MSSARINMDMDEPRVYTVREYAGALDMRKWRERILEIDELRNDTLVDLRAARCNLSVMDQYDLAIFALRQAGSRAYKYALVVGEHNIDAAETFVLVGSNRGLQVELFTDPVTADHWLSR